MTLFAGIEGWTTSTSGESGQSDRREIFVGIVRLKGAPQLKVPLVLASRRGEPSAVVQQFRKFAKDVAKADCAG